MLTTDDILVFLKDNKHFLFENFNIIKIGIFGSFAKNSANESSDIDLIVEFLPETLDLFHKKRAIKDFLNKKFNRKIDVCREKYIKPLYKEQILKDVIYV